MKRSFSVISNLQTNWRWRRDFQSVDQHTDTRWLGQASVSILIMPVETLCNKWNVLIQIAIPIKHLNFRCQCRICFPIVSSNMILCQICSRTFHKVKWLMWNIFRQFDAFSVVCLPFYPVNTNGWHTCVIYLTRDKENQTDGAIWHDKPFHHLGPTAATMDDFYAWLFYTLSRPGIINQLHWAKIK